MHTPNIQDLLVLVVTTKYNCPNCDSSILENQHPIYKTDSEFCDGTVNNTDPHYFWFEVHKCSNCNFTFKYKETT